MRELQLSLRPKTNLFVMTIWNWYYYDTDGKLLTGRQTIDGVQLYFDKNGKLSQGSLVDIDVILTTLTKDSGVMWTNSSLTLNE